MTESESEIYDGRLKFVTLQQGLDVILPKVQATRFFVRVKWIAHVLSLVDVIFVGKLA